MNSSKLINVNFRSLKILTGYGFTRSYDKSGKLRYSGYMNGPLKHSKFAVSYGSKGGIMYSGGYKDNVYEGYGVEFQGNGSGKIRKLGSFVCGELNGNGMI
jgi:hypothetical protein